MVAALSPIAIICSNCGSADVSRDAWAQWDVESQRWTLRHVFDHAYCHTCDQETSLVEQALRPFENIAIT